MAEGSFDELIHAPARLRVCGLLRPVKQMDFALLRDTLVVSDATLSKHLKTLSEAGYVSLAKASSDTRNDARRLTWVSLTSVGRSAFDGHMRALLEIAGAEVRPATPAP